jgi:hypothetical protein
MLRRQTISLAAVLALAAGSAAAAAPEIEYAYPDQSVWTTAVDELGRPANPLLRLAKVMFAEAGLPWHGAPYPAARMFSALRDGPANFSMLVKAPALDACCLVSRAPVAGTELHVYWVGDTPPVARREDLAGHTLILVHGYSYGQWANFLADPGNRIDASRVHKHQAAFAMLAEGRGDYVLDYAGPAEEVLAERPIPGIHHTVLDRLDVHLVLTRRTAEAERLMARLEAIAAGLDRAAIIKGPQGGFAER